jgi:hypothetical protein
MRHTARAGELLAASRLLATKLDFETNGLAVAISVDAADLDRAAFVRNKLEKPDFPYRANALLRSGACTACRLVTSRARRVVLLIPESRYNGSTD